MPPGPPPAPAATIGSCRRGQRRQRHPQRPRLGDGLQGHQQDQHRDVGAGADQRQQGVGEHGAEHQDRRAAAEGQQCDSDGRIGDDRRRVRRSSYPRAAGWRTPARPAGRPPAARSGRPAAGQGRWSPVRRAGHGGVTDSPAKACDIGPLSGDSLSARCSLSGWRSLFWLALWRRRAGSDAHAHLISPIRSAQPPEDIAPTGRFHRDCLDRRGWVSVGAGPRPETRRAAAPRPGPLSVRSRSSGIRAEAFERHPGAHR